MGKKKTSKEKTTSAHDKLAEKVLASGEAVAKAWAGAVDTLVEEQEQLVIDTTQTLDEYSYYVSDIFLRWIPGTETLWFRNESAEEGDRLRDVLQPKSYEIRCAIAELYRRLYPIPEEAKPDEPEPVEAEVVDEESSGAADATGKDVKTQIINNPTIVNQYGEKNVHIDHVENLKL